MPWHFGPFRLDLTQAGLWRAEQPVPLRPKTLALLAYLVDTGWGPCLSQRLPTTSERLLPRPCLYPRLPPSGSTR